MRVVECCNKSVLVAQRQTSAREAARMMRDLHVGSVVVVDPCGDSVAPVGMITDRDLVIEILAKGAAPEQVMLGDIMSSHVVTADCDDDLLVTLDRMRESGVRRVPVVNDDGTLAGILCLDDVLEFLAGALGRVPQLVRNQQYIESHRLI